MQNRWVPWNWWQCWSGGGAVCLVNANPALVDDAVTRHGGVWFGVGGSRLHCGRPLSVPWSPTLSVMGRKRTTPQSLLHGVSVPNQSVRPSLQCRVREPGCLSCSANSHTSLAFSWDLNTDVLRGATPHTWVPGKSHSALPQCCVRFVPLRWLPHLLGTWLGLKPWCLKGSPCMRPSSKEAPVCATDILPLAGGCRQSFSFERL